jgi:hypothetical protein
MLNDTGTLPEFSTYTVKLFAPPGSRAPQLIEEVTFVQALSQYTFTPTAFTFPVLVIVLDVTNSPRTVATSANAATAEAVPIAIFCMAISFT